MLTLTLALTLPLTLTLTLTLTLALTLTLTLTLTLALALTLILTLTLTLTLALALALTLTRPGRPATRQRNSRSWWRCYLSLTLTLGWGYLGFARTSSGCGRELELSVVVQGNSQGGSQGGGRRRVGTVPESRWRTHCEPPSRQSLPFRASVSR